MNISPQGSGRRPAPAPGSAPVLDRAQRLEFLALIHDGLGRALACAQLGLSPQALGHTLRRSAAFRRALAHVEQVRADNLYAVLYHAALHGDTDAARYLLDRHDRAQPGG